MDNRPAVLVVDDEVEIGQLLNRYLTREGFAVETRGRGLEALEVATQRDFALVVLDLGLPDLDGFEVCRQIRASSDVPILMLTARDRTYDKVVGLGLGADDYVSKPFDVDEVVARVKALLRRWKAPNHELRFPDLVLDRLTRTVSGRDYPELTALEFELLWMLAEAPQRVFTRHQIQERVWGPGVHLDDNTLSVHVRRLRRKVEVDADTPRVILTVRHLGYKFGLEPLLG